MSSGLVCAHSISVGLQGLVFWDHEGKRPINLAFLSYIQLCLAVCRCLRDCPGPQRA